MNTAEILEFINEDMLTQSLLYDLDLMPEQLDEGTNNWGRMVLIVVHMRAQLKAGEVKAENAAKAKREANA